MSANPGFMKLALDALRANNQWYCDYDDTGSYADIALQLQTQAAIDAIVAHTAQPAEVDEAKERENIAQVYGVSTHVTHRPEWRHTVDVWLAAKRHAASVAAQPPADTAKDFSSMAYRWLRENGANLAIFRHTPQGVCGLLEGEELDRAIAEELNLPQPASASVSAQEASEAGAQAADEAFNAHKHLLASKQPASAQAEPVATVKSWVNGSYGRKYEIEWLSEVDAGAKLYTESKPATSRELPEGMVLAPRHVISEAASAFADIGWTESVARAKSLLAAAPAATAEGV